MIDYYRILQLDSDATERDIKLAFRRLAKQFHPDVNQSADASEQFKKVYMAYEVLSDPYRKKLYDTLKHDANNNSPKESNYNYNAGFEEWEFKAEQRAKFYADMRFSQFENEELKGLDYYNQQFALFIAIIGLFLIGGGTLYFSINIFLAFFRNQTPSISLVGAILLAVFGLFILYYVVQMSAAFRQSIARKIRRKPH